MRAEQLQMLSKFAFNSGQTLSEDEKKKLFEAIDKIAEKPMQERKITIPQRTFDYLPAGRSPSIKNGKNARSPSIRSGRSPSIRSGRSPSIRRGTL